MNPMVLDEKMFTELKKWSDENYAYHETEGILEEGREEHCCKCCDRCDCS